MTDEKTVEKSEEEHLDATSEEDQESRMDEENAQENEEQGFSQATKEGQMSYDLDDGEITKEELVEALKECYDPEIPVNLYDLGLIHEARADGKQVDIDMTLTAPGCGFGPQIAKNVEHRLLEEESVDEANVEIVHDPPWNRDMVSEEGQAQLSMLGF